MPELTIATPDDATVIITATVPMTLDAAYRAFTDARQLAHWFWPETLQASYQLEVVPGGMWRTRSEIADIGFTAVFGEVEPRDRLAMTWEWDGNDSISKVEIGFAAAAEGTTVTITHSDNATPQERDAHREGWTDCLSRLVAL
ncbi:MAG TPA: SRPBCC domain-containing protein [Jatrophihabitantaceae bacterium]|jgi:uncharacterized protein YndB with AHSA1/START domain